MRVLRLGLFGAVIVAAANPAAAVQAHDHALHQAAPPAIDPEIDAFICGYFGLVEQGDPAAILDQIDQQFVIKWPAGPPVTDREQLRQALTALYSKVRQTIRWKVVETQVHGDWAWARVEETAVHQPRAGGAPRTLDGSHLMILRRQDGKWLLHRDFAALNAAPNPGAP